MNGHIKLLNAEKEYGFIVGEDAQEYFFHKSALKNIEFKELEKGLDVTFEDVDSAKGLRAEDIYV